MSAEFDTSLERWWFESHSHGKRQGQYFGTADFLALTFDEFDDSRWVKSFQLIPGGRYTFTIHASAQNIETEQPGGIGANICIFGTSIHSTDYNNGSGTFNGPLSVTFQVPSNGRLDIGLRLGFWHSESKGSVTFSDFRMSLLEEWEVVGTGQVRLRLRADDVSHIGRDPLEKFVQRMAGVYFSMTRLYGRQPFDGAIVVIECRPGVDAHWSRGNPIVWHRDCCLDYFRSSNMGIMPVLR
jgi:hypothetical protein